MALGRAGPASAAWCRRGRRRRLGGLLALAKLRSREQAKFQVLLITFPHPMAWWSCGYAGMSLACCGNPLPSGVPAIVDITFSFFQFILNQYPHTRILDGGRKTGGPCCDHRNRRPGWFLTHRPRACPGRFRRLPTNCPAATSPDPSPARFGGVLLGALLVWWRRDRLKNSFS